MEQQALVNNSIPDVVEYITEVEMKEMHELELDIAVKYFVEFAKQDAWCTNKENGLGKNEFIHDNKVKEKITLENVEIDWKEVVSNPKELKLKVLNWLVSERKIW